jgi:hypothetical protein
MSKSPPEQYVDLMAVIRKRFDLINSIRSIPGDRFARAEDAAFHGRKIIEGIAFGCLVAVENGLKAIPRDAQGQWNAKAIFFRLDAKKLNAFPCSAIVREATKVERTANPGVTITIEGQPLKNLDRDELSNMYADLHRWLHEINPYVEEGRASFLQRYENELWDALVRLEAFIERHDIGIGGQLFFLRSERQNRWCDKGATIIKVSKSVGWAKARSAVPTRSN